MTYESLTSRVDRLVKESDEFAKIRIDTLIARNDELVKRNEKLHEQIVGIKGWVAVIIVLAGLCGISGAVASYIFLQLKKTVASAQIQIVSTQNKISNLEITSGILSAGMRDTQKQFDAARGKSMERFDQYVLSKREALLLEIKNGVRNDIDAQGARIAKIETDAVFYNKPLKIRGNIENIKSDRSCIGSVRTPAGSTAQGKPIAEAVDLRIQGCNPKETWELVKPQ